MDRNILKKLYVRIRRTDNHWLWRGGIGHSDVGFPMFRCSSEKSSMLLVHKIIWEDTNKKTVPECSYLKKICTEPMCVNPEHYVVEKIPEFKETDEENSRGGVKKLSAAQVRKIKFLITNGVKTQSEIVTIYGVSKQSVSNLILLKHWEDINIA